MATNDFKPFATGAGANVLSQDEWANLPAILTGFQSGKAASAQVNKALRQSSVMASMLGKFIVDYGGKNALDDGDIANLEAAFAESVKGRLLNVKTFTTSGTYTPSPGTKSIIVECQGGGGGGGAAVVSGATAALSAGSGGAAGSYARGRFTNLGSSYPVIVGAGGAGSTNTGSLGRAGGTSSLGGLISASGGYGATSIGEGNTAFIANGSGQSLPGGTFVTGGNIFASPGQNLSGEAFRLSATIGSGGYGQASIFGGGGNAAKSSNQAGLNGVGYGSGGGGARVAGTVTPVSYAGGDGGAGVVIIWEYS